MRDPNSSDVPSYSIAAVSKLTGVSCHALRVWERRYGFPVPRRTESGHRRYDAGQVQLLRHVALLLHRGRPIGELMADLHDGRIQGDPVWETPVEVGASRLIDGLMTGDVTVAEAEYQRLTAGLGPREICSRVIEPGLSDAGDRWFRGTCSMAQDRFATGYLIRKLHVLIDSAQRVNARPSHTVLLGSVQGDRHDGGFLLFGLHLELAGWRAVFLGPDLPVRELQDAAARWRPAALAFSFVLSRNINKRFAELGRIRDVPVFVGGRSILNYQALARRHGLIPLPGSAGEVIGPFLARVMSRMADWGEPPG